MVAAALIVVAGIVAAVIGTGDGGDEGDDHVTIDRAPADPEEAAAMVAVTFTDPSMGVTSGTGRVDLTLRFVGQDGGTVAERSWREVEEEATNAANAGGTPPGGLVQRVPVGELRLEATLRGPGEPTSCTQPFRSAQGDRLILRLDQGQLGGMSTGSAGGEAPCAPVQPVAEWIEGRTSPSGEPYVGLPLADAESRARSEGLTTRVVGIDGTDLMMTMDLRPDRLDLMLFDGVVVAAQLPDESPVTPS